MANDRERAKRQFQKQLGNLFLDTVGEGITLSRLTGGKKAIPQYPARRKKNMANSVVLQPPQRSGPPQRAPVAISRKTGRDKPAGFFTYTHTEPIGTLKHQGDATTEGRSLFVNEFASTTDPLLVGVGNAALCPGTAGVNNAFARGRMTVTLRLEAIQATDVPGRMLVGHMANVNDAAPISWRAATTYPHETCSAWQSTKPLHVKMDSELRPVVNTNSLTFQLPSGAVFDPREYFWGKVFFYDSIQVSDGTAIARVYADFRIQLEQIRPNASLVPQSALATLGTATTSLAFGASGVKSWTRDTLGDNDTYLEVVSATEFSIALPQGSWLINVGWDAGGGFLTPTLVASGTGITQYSLSTNNVCAVAGSSDGIYETRVDCATNTVVTFTASGQVLSSGSATCKIQLARYT